MRVGQGFTAKQIRRLVDEYHRQPHGTKGAWLAGQGLSYGQLQRWRVAVFQGDLERGLIPREGSGMPVSPSERNAVAKQHAKELAKYEKKISQLTEKVTQLQASNDALGKAIGLLHSRSVQEPEATEAKQEPKSS